MKSLLTLCLTLALTSLVSAQNDNDSETLEQHARLAEMSGVWDVEILMTTPDEKTSSTGVETVRMVGDFWSVSDLEFEYMGVPTIGHGTLGFDASKDKYVGTWVESTNPYMSTMEGEYDEENKAIVFLMQSKDPSGASADFRITMASQDETHRTFKLELKIDEDQFIEMLEMKYTKREEK